jgi:hypothetical protein
MPVPRQPLQRSPNVRNDAARSRSSGIGFRKPLQERKTQEESTKTRCRRCRSFCVLASPAAPPGPAVRGHRLLRPRQHTETAQKAHPGNKSNGSAETSSKNKKTERGYGDPLPPLPRSCVLAAGPVAQVDPTRLCQPQRIRRTALTFTMCCPKPFNGSLPGVSMQRRSLKR